MHSLGVGISGTGKTTLFKKFAADFERRGIRSLVLDPNGDSWPCSFQTTNPAKFLEIAKKSRRCALFVEEAGASVGRGKNAADLQWLTTRSRHWGHHTFIIAQRAQQVDLTIRTQCTTGYIFRQSIYDCRLLADHFADEAILQASTLGRGEFLYVRSCGGTIKMRPIRL